jgi:hypothetical protein
VQIAPETCRANVVKKNKKYIVGPELNMYVNYYAFSSATYLKPSSWCCVVAGCNYIPHAARQGELCVLCGSQKQPAIISTRYIG